MKVMKGHEVAKLVNALRDCAVQYHAHQSLRDRLSRIVQDALNRQIESPETQQNRT